MIIVWDEPKRIYNLAKHGYDFAELELNFFSAARVVEAKRGRAKALGHFSGVVISVVFRPLGAEAISIISMRPAGRKERSTL